LIEKKEPDIFGGPVLPIFEKPPPEWIKEAYFIRAFRDNSGWLSKDDSLYLVGSNIFFKKQLLDSYGGFDPKLGMIGGAIGYHEETAVINRAFDEKKKIYRDFRHVGSPGQHVPGRSHLACPGDQTR